MRQPPRLRYNIDQLRTELHWAGANSMMMRIDSARQFPEQSSLVGICELKLNSTQERPSLWIEARDPGSPLISWRKR